jgi:transposase InsO family protein
MSKDSIFFDISEEEVKKVLEKYALLEPLLDDYLSDSKKRELRKEACYKLGVSERTLRRYLYKLRKKGIRGLIKKPRNDIGKPRVFDNAILEKALKLLDENPYRSIPKLMSILKANTSLSEKVKKISCHTLYFHIKKSGYDFKKKRKNSEKIYHRFEALYPNQLWQGDAREGIYLPDPVNAGKWRKTYLFAWIDDFSRKVMYAKYYWDMKLPSMEDSFRYAALRWALPIRVYCDNGKVYRAKYFEFVLSDLGIKKIHHPAYSAWCKGKVENLMKTFKGFQREAKLCSFKTLEELNSTFFAWLEIEYNNRIHTTTGEPPNQRYQKGLKDHQPERVKDIDEFNRLFLFREERKIDKYGKVRLENNFYPVTDIRPYEKVVVRFDPFDLSEVLIYYKNKFHQKSKPKILKTKEIIQNIPEEEEKKEDKVSVDAINYFNLLRKKHNEDKLNSLDDVKFTDITKNKDK